MKLRTVHRLNQIVTPFIDMACAVSFALVAWAFVEAIEFLVSYTR